jgi:hypothetical protein
VSRFAAILVAFFAVAAVPAVDAASAASAEDAVKSWIASVPGNDWKIAYRTLAYDQATDRTTIRNLTAASASLDLVITFTTVVIAGYTPTPDGGFTAKSFTVDVGTMSSDEAKLTITGVEATNFGTAAMTPLPFDKEKPIASIVQIYSNLLKIHVDHAGISSLSFKDESDDTGFTYSDFAVDKWADGKVASMRMGPMDATFTGENGEPVSFQIGGVETRDTDLDAIVRVYDPSRYVNGVGDQVWRTVVGLATYHDFTIASADFNMTMGAWTMENLKMRQPKESFTPALDKVAALGKGNGDDLPPEAMRAVFNMWSAFALGKLSLTDLSLDTEAGFGTLDAFTITDFSADGIGEISVDYLDAFYTDGFITLTRLAAGGIVFPGVDKMIAAYDAGLKDQDIDFGDLSARLGYVELKDLDFETEDTPEVALERFRLDFGNYVGLVPTAIGLDVVGFDTSIDLFKNSELDDMLRALGYERVHADYRVKLGWKEADSTVALDDFRLAIADAGVLSGNAVLGGLARKDLDNVGSLREALMHLNLVSSSLVLEDKSIINRWIAQQAYEMKVDQNAVRTALANQAASLAQGIGSKAFQDKLSAALKTYILRPGSLTVTAKPPDALPVSGIALFAAIFPETLPEILGLNVTAVAGPEPTPFKYAPPAKQDDLRHVPLKKY